MVPIHLFLMFKLRLSPTFFKSLFNLGTYTFHAPLTGKYSFTSSISIEGLLAANTNMYVYFVTTATTYYPCQVNPNLMGGNGGANLGYNYSIVVPCGEV